MPLFKVLKSNINAKTSSTTPAYILTALAHNTHCIQLFAFISKKKNGTRMAASDKSLTEMFLNDIHGLKPVILFAEKKSKEKVQEFYETTLSILKKT